MTWLDGTHGVWVVVSLVLGCGAAPLGPEQSDGSDGSEGGSTGAPSSSEGDTAPPVEQGPDCEPADASLALRFELVGTFGETCVVVEPVEGAAITLECTSVDAPTTTTGSLIVDIDPQLPIFVALGAELTLEIVESQVVWEQPTPRYSIFARHGQTNELVFAAIDANNLDWVAELSPLGLEAIDDACTSEPDDANCRTTERLMWNAQHDGMVVPVGDASRSSVGGYAVHIQRAADGDFLECIDVETDFYEALIVRTQ